MLFSCKVNTHKRNMKSISRRPVRDVVIKSTSDSNLEISDADCIVSELLTPPDCC